MNDKRVPLKKIMDTNPDLKFQLQSGEIATILNDGPWDDRFDEQTYFIKIKHKNRPKVVPSSLLVTILENQEDDICSQCGIELGKGELGTCVKCLELE